MPPAPATEDRFDRAARFALDHRVALLAVAVALSAGLGIAATGLRVDTSNEYMFVQGDPILERYEAFQEQFGSDDFVYVLLEPGDLFTPRELARLATLQDDIETRVPHVRKVTSLLDVEHVRATEDGIAVEPLIGRDAVPSDPTEAAALRERAFLEPQYTELFVDPTGRHAGVLVELEPPPQGSEFRAGVTDAVRALVDAPPYDDLDARVVGPTILDTDLDRTLTGEFRRFAGIALGLIVAILAWMFRRPVDVLAPLAIVAFTNLWLLGGLALTDTPLTLMSIILPALITVVGTCDAIHVVSEYRRALARTGQPRAAVAATLRHTALACLFTTLTTMVGFGSLIAMDLRPGQEMGLAAAGGVAIAFVLTFLLLPVLLPLGSRRASASHAPTAGERRMARALAVVAELSIRRRPLILAVSAVLAAVSVWGATRIDVSADFVRMFDESTRLRRDYEHVEATLGGTISLEILARSEEPGGILEPAFLEELEAFEGWIADWPRTRSVVSYLDALRSLDGALAEEPGERSLPDSRELAAQLLLLYEMGGASDLDRIVSNDRDVAHMTVRLASGSTAAFRELEHGIAAWSAEHSREAELVLTGEVPLFVGISEYVTTSQLKSFGLAFGAVAAMMVLLFRSVRLGLLAMIPNLTPVVGTLGYMGLAGIDLNIGTVLIASVAIGIAVDDTIHYTTHYRRHRDEGLSPVDAVRATTGGVGMAVLSTSIVISLGFSIFGLSDFSHLTNFGLLTALTVLLALVADFLLLPALLLTAERHPSVLPASVAAPHAHAADEAGASALASEPA